MASASGNNVVLGSTIRTTLNWAAISDTDGATSAAVNE
jgi:hypothetical protein